MSKEKLKLVYWPDEHLKQKTTKVEKFDKELHEEVKQMFSVLHKENGVGLAANQVGLLKSLFVIDVPITKHQSTKRTFINPVLELSGVDVAIEEMCLSFHGKQVKVPRKSHCKIKYQNLLGMHSEEEFDGLLAIVVQHECLPASSIIETENRTKNY